ADVRCAHHSFKGCPPLADGLFVAVDAAAPRTVRVAIPAWLWVSGIVTASFLVRLIAAAARPVPHYLPDEYIYPSLARSIAEHGRPLIRGVGVHFPALLDPLLTAPVWLGTGDPGRAVGSTHGLAAALVAAPAVPASP